MGRWETEGWKEEDLDKLELKFLTQLFDCSEAERVDGTLYYAKYLYKVGVNSDTYPVYLKLLSIPNHWVVDALLGDKEPSKYFNEIQPNHFILAECFRAFRHKRGGVYEKSLAAFLGILIVTYKNAGEGYRVYPLTAEDVNNLGKHLDENQPQTFPINTLLLTILDKIASLMDPGTLENATMDVMKVATQANNIRGKFLDMTKHLNEAIPDLLLERGDYKTEEIPPTTT